MQSFLEQHQDSDLNRLILKGSPFDSVNVQELAEQIQARRKCRLKLPMWSIAPGIVFPSSLNIEQSSSEKAAQYKASLVSGKRMIDMTGGFGVDTLYFSKKFDRVTHVEIDRALHEIVDHNLKILNVGNVDCILGNSLELLSTNNENFDWIYLDPSRRGSGQERVFQLEDCSPNVIENLDLILSKTDRVLLKLSPFMDISKALNQLKNVEEVHALAINNEVKELLFLINIKKSQPATIKAVNLTQGAMDVLESEPGLRREINYGPVKAFLYEPNAAIRKTGLYSELSSRYNLNKIHPNSHLFTGEELIDFPGRAFRVKKQIKYSRKSVRKELGLTRANITTRNFYESVAQIRKRTKIQEGGEDYLFFTMDHRAKPIVIHCTKAEIPES